MGTLMEDNRVTVFGCEGNWRCVLIDFDLKDVLNSCEYNIKYMDNIFLEDKYIIHIFNI